MPIILVVVHSQPVNTMSCLDREVVSLEPCVIGIFTNAGLLVTLVKDVVKVAEGRVVIER